MAAPRIGFLGLGIMGGGMARRLLAAGFPVTVYNRSRAKVDALVSAGARRADSARDAADGAAIVFAMVADDAASRALWLGENGALAGVAPKALVVECSTLTVTWVQELARAVASVGAEFVDAPVTGSKGAAAAGELNFLVGGTAAAVETVRPALDAMGRSVNHLGPVGSGALLKLVNNFLAGVQVAAMAEAMAWLERTELDRAKALSLLLDGAAGSPVTKVVAARMAGGDFTANFPLRLMAKDLGYAIAEAAARQHSLAMASAALARFRDGVAAGHGDEDMAAVVRPLRTGQPGA